MTPRARRTAGRVALAALPVVVLALFFVHPVLGMVRLGFADGPGPVLEVLTRPRTLRVLGFTVASAGAATLVTLILGLPAAYALHRLRWPGRDLVRAAVLVPFVLPTVVVGVAFRQLLAPGGWLGGLGLDGTPTAIVAALAFFNVSVVVRTVGASWESLDPRREEAAAALGAPPWRVFLTVTLPALRPALLGAASVVFLFCSTAFGLVLVLGGLRYANVETEIWLLTTQELDLAGAAALSVLQVVVITVLLLLTRRLGGDPGARARTSAPVRPVVRRDAPVLAWTGLVVLLLALPVLSLVARSLQREGRWTLANYVDLARGGDLVEVPALTALSNSLQFAAVATALSLLLGVLVSWLVAQRARTRLGRRATGILDGVFMLPLGVSAVTLGFGFLVTLDEPPLDLRDSVWLVPIAQAMVALPLVVRSLAPVLRSIDPRQREAAASLGAGPWRVLATVDAPMARRALLAGGGFAFAVSLGEFGATSFLARADVPTLPVVVYRLIGQPGAANTGTAMAASVVLAVACAGIMLLVERLRVSSVGGF
ncbi:iron ABC transporter permease [Alteromonas gracilis]